MSSLNIALFCLPISMFQCTSVFSYHFESLLFLLSFIYGESDHVSYMTDKSSCPIYYTLPWVISVSCSLFKDSSHYLIYNLIQSPLYLLSFFFVSTFFCPVPSHSCDPLEDLLPSLSQHGSISVLPDDEDLEF